MVSLVLLAQPLKNADSDMKISWGISGGYDMYALRTDQAAPLANTGDQSPIRWLFQRVLGNKHRKTQHEPSGMILGTADMWALT